MYLLCLYYYGPHEAASYLDCWIGDYDIGPGFGVGSTRSSSCSPKHQEGELLKSGQGTKGQGKTDLMRHRYYKNLK